MTHLQIIGDQFSLCDVNVISVRVEQKIAYLSPRSLASRPRTKKLNWITAGLGPSPARLQSFIELPTKVLAPLIHKNHAPYVYVRDARAAPLGFIPNPFPLIQASPSHGINISGAANFVMTKNSRPERDTDLDSAPTSYLQSEPFKYLF
jgi:hypothetical protein